MTVTFRGTVDTHYILGNNSATQNLLVIENGYQSRVDVNIREFHFYNDSVAVLTSVPPLIKVSRCTAISGGQILEKTAYVTTETSDANVVFRSPLFNWARIDATPGDVVWQQFAQRAHTLIGQTQCLTWIYCR